MLENESSPDGCTTSEHSMRRSKRRGTTKHHGGNPKRARPSRAFFVFALLLVLVPLVVAANASAAYNFQNDESGPNDEPGQKDLNLQAVDTAVLTGHISVLWNWDETGTSGAGQSLDACTLFDTDASGDVGFGFADFSVCATAGGNPAADADTIVYICEADSRVDRCAGPSVVPGTPSSVCTVTSPSDTDPWSGTGKNRGDSFPNDARAECDIVLADVGAAAAKLINTCSYPSGEPNSDPSDCILVPRDAFIIIKKVASPNEGTFPFTLDGNAAFTATGSQQSDQIPVRSDINHDVDENIPAGWGLTSASCAGAGGGNGTADLTTGTISGINPNPDDIITCTFNDSKLFAGEFTVTKTANPASLPEPGGPVTFSVTVFNQFAGAVSLTALSDNVYGNIADASNPNIVSTTCSVPQALAATDGSSGGADTYNCSFVANVTGRSVDAHRHRVGDGRRGD